MLRIPLRTLRALALGVLLLPTAAFLLTWVRPLVALPCVIALAAALFLYVRAQRRAAPDAAYFECSIPTLLCVLACAALWTLLSGIGGMFYQNEDHYGRNAIFHDLLNNPWPVYFEGTPYALTYYVGYWIVPALLGKGAAALLGEGVLWGAANAALYVQTVCLLTLTFLLLMHILRVGRLREAMLTLLVFVMFSGMDVLMSAFQNAPNIQAEWWAELYQFSSHTTCLFWVYNQAVPAWLALMLLLSTPEDVSSFALLGLSALAFAPLPFVGLLPLFLALFLARGAGLVRARGAREGVVTLLRACFSARNLLAILAIVPCFFFYFSANQASSQAPFRPELFTYAFSPSTIAFRLTLFALIEYLAYSLVMGKRYGREPLFLAANALLLLAPLFRLGFNADFSMRASIPGITVLCVYAIGFVLEALRERRHRYAACVLCVLLFLGAFTPLLEFERGAYKVKLAGTPLIYSDPYGTVLHPEADTFNFICEDTQASFFYRHLARKGTNHS